MDEMSTTTTPSAPGDRWTRGGEQERSVRTQDALLDAAESLFGRNGVADTSVTDVARHAGRSVGSLYHHFTNKATLVSAVVDRILGDLESTAVGAVDPARWEGHDIRSIVRTYVSNSLDLRDRRPGYKRVIIEVALTDPATADRYQRFRRRLDDGLTTLLVARSAEIGHPDPSLAARFCIDQLTAMLTARLDSDGTPSQLEDDPDTTFIEESLGSVVSYLRLT